MQYFVVSILIVCVNAVNKFIKSSSAKRDISKSGGLFEFVSDGK